MSADLFPDTLPDPRLKAAVAELRRERSMREHLYPQWVAKGRMAKETADKQMQALRWAIEMLGEIDGS